MKVDGGLGTGLSTAGTQARDAESFGYDGAWIAETSRDPFLPLTLGFEHTSRIELGTSIAVAFARSPMTTANTGYDLNQFSGGRFILGLGSQIKPHIEKRFSMKWGRPAARMREFVQAMRAIWDCWENGTRLDFRGDFYTHTLMTPFFSPGASQHGAPRVFLAGVGPLMTKVAGEVCDGFFCHGFTTERYLREVTIPAVEEGRKLAGKTLDGFEICKPSFVVTGNGEEELEAAKVGTRRQIAFYGSTPAYRPVLDLHGWGDLQTDLHRMSKERRWDEMGTLIDDEILGTFAVVGEPEEIGPELQKRYGDVISRISFYAPYDSHADRWQRVLGDIKG